MTDSQVAAKTPPSGHRRYLTLALLALAIGTATWWLLPTVRPSRPFMPLPNPNGYEDFLEANRSIVGPVPRFDLTAIWDVSRGPASLPDPASWDEGRAFVEANRAALARARVGLERECVVPVPARPGFATQARANGLVKLGKLFHWEGVLAVREGRIADATSTFLDLIRLGAASSRGGLGADVWAPGVWVEADGYDGLMAIRTGLDPAACRKAIAVLREVDRRREPYAAFWARDAAYHEAIVGRFRTIRWELENWRNLAQERKAVSEHYDEWITEARLVQVELALRAFEVEQGHEPETLEALVPAYLPDLPFDPFSGRPFVYRREESGHRLYGVGRDRLDDGGAPMSSPDPGRDRPTGDILPPDRRALPGP